LLSPSCEKSYFSLFAGNSRRVLTELREKDDFALHTHVVGDTADTALTWNWPDLGSDLTAGEAGGHSHVVAERSSAETRGGLPPRAGIGPTRPTT
jgi:hypothetical protein